MNANFEIDNATASQLRQAAGIKDYDAAGNLNPLPAYIETAYKHFHVPFKQIGGTIPRADTYALIVMTANLLKGEAIGECPGGIKTVYEAWVNGKISHGDSLEVMNRGAWYTAKFISASKDGRQVTALIDANGEQRRFAQDRVRLPVGGSDVITTENANGNG